MEHSEKILSEHNIKKLYNWFNESIEQIEKLKEGLKD